MSKDALSKERISYSSGGSSSGLDSTDSEEDEKNEKEEEESKGSTIDTHLIVTSALGYAVLYPDVDKSGFAGGAPLQGMQGGERDACLSVCTGDLDLDGKAELLVGTYGGAVVHYPLASPGEIAPTGDDVEGLFFENSPFSVNASPETPASPANSPLNAQLVVPQSEKQHLQSPFAISSPATSPRGIFAQDLKSRFSSLGGSGRGFKAVMNVLSGVDGGDRRDSSKGQSNPSNAANAGFKPIEKWATPTAPADSSTHAAGVSGVICTVYPSIESCASFLSCACLSVCRGFNSKPRA